MDKRSEKKPEDKKRSEEKMQKERPVEEKGAREEEERTKREMEEGQGGSQEKKSCGASSPQLLGLATARTTRRCRKEGIVRPHPRAPGQRL